MRRPVFRTLIAAVAACALSAGPAFAQGADQRYPVGSPALQTAQAIAIDHWGANPCGGVYAVAWTPLDWGTNATASWRNPTDAWNNPGANFDCRIDLNPNADYDFPKLCTVMTHEVGHLLGHQHDSESGQLMSAFYTSPIPACQIAEPGAAPPAPVPAADPGDEGVDIVASTEPRRTLRKTSTKAKTKRVKRCATRKVRVFRRAYDGRRVVRYKRVKRCRWVKVKAATARKATRRKRPAARAAAAAAPRYRAAHAEPVALSVQLP